MKKENVIAVFFFLAVGLAFTWPVFHNIEYWGIQDWDQHFFYHAVPRETILEYHQIPLWNPYTCGGTVLLANPQSRCLSPTFGLVLIFGVVRGLKLEIWLHLAFGLLGAYRLARRFQLNIPAALVSSFIFMGNSIYAAGLTVGMTWILSIAYLPWAFAYFLQARNKIKYAVVCGFFLALMYLDGGAYPLMITVLFFGIYSLISVCLKRVSPAVGIKVFAGALIFALCLGAIKFFPSIDFLLEHPRRMADRSGFSLQSLQFSLLSRDQTVAAAAHLPRGEGRGFVRGMTQFMDENGMYIGIIPLLLFCVGLAFQFRRRAPLALCLLIFLWLSFGTRVPFSLWALLRRLPVFDSMRVAQRVRMVMMLCVSLFAGFGFRAISERGFQRIKKRGTPLLLTVLLAGIILLDLVYVNSRIFRDAFPIPPIRTEKNPAFYQVWSMPAYDKNGPVEPGGYYATFGSLYPAFLSNVGIINAYETSIVPRNAVARGSKDYRGEVFLEGTEGEVRIIRFTPNVIELEVEPEGEGYLILNQNYYSGWRIRGDKSARVEARRGVIGVKIAPPFGKIALYYLPTSFIIGAIVSIITLPVGIVLFTNRNFNNLAPD